MNFRLPFWLPIHQLLVKNQNLVKKFFLVFYFIAISYIAFGFYLFAVSPDNYSILYELAGKFGTVALVLFLTTLIPGILIRFRVFPLFSASIVLFRRQIGILMYFIALIHSFYIFSIPAIMNHVLRFESLPPTGLTGVVTLSILFPVWITSNDLAQKGLGKLWKTIQRLTYVAMISLFFHVAMTELSTAIIIIFVFILEIASWLNFYFFKKFKSSQSKVQLEKNEQQHI